MWWKTLLLSGLLTACAASPYSVGTQALQSGNLQLAEAKLIEAVRQGDNEAWNNLAIVYDRTGRRDLATRAFITAARFGSPEARISLIRRGVAIPAPDLQGAQRSGADVLGGALSSFADGQAAGRQYLSPRSINCTSSRYGNSVSTTCD